MKSILFALLLLFSYKIDCDEEFKDTLATIKKVKGGNELVEQVLEEGPLKIKRERELPFGAYWDASKRTIGLVASENSTYSLLFELHNAAAQKDFEHANSLAANQKISKNEYIRMIETIEYKNTYKTSALIDEGIRQGLLPRSSQTRYYSSLEAHLRDQERTGHSAWIADIYESLAYSS